MKKKPILCEDNILKRLEFADSHIHWTHEWRKVIFSDEKKFNLDGPDGLSYYWHDLKHLERIFSTHQSGSGSVMIWGAIGYLKKAFLEFVDTRMNATKYQEMVAPLFPAWGYEMAVPRWELQQDNAPIHVARSTLECFRERNIKLFKEWPSRSPDMNIIENVWGHLARKVYENGRQYANKLELKDAIVSAWNGLDHDYIRRLYDSLPRRILALHDAKG